MEFTYTMHMASFSRSWNPPSRQEHQPKYHLKSFLIRNFLMTHQTKYHLKSFLNLDLSSLCRFFFVLHLELRSWPLNNFSIHNQFTYTRIVQTDSASCKIHEITILVLTFKYKRGRCKIKRQTSFFIKCFISELFVLRDYSSIHSPR